MQATAVAQIDASIARRTAIDREIIEMPSRSELNLENSREVAVLRIVVAVEAVVHRADLGIVSRVARPGLEVAPDDRDRRAQPAVAWNAREQTLRQLITHGQLAELHEAARLDEPILDRVAVVDEGV